MNKEELLIEAKQRYQIGTVIKSFDGKEYTITQELKWQYGNKGISHYNIYWVYSDGKWAEIVSKPKEEIPDYIEATEDYNDYFIKGKIYKVVDKQYKNSICVICNFYIPTFDIGQHLWICLTEDIAKPSTKESYDMQNQETQPIKLEDLKEGVVLSDRLHELIVQGVMKELVFCIDKNQSAKTRSIHQLIRDGYTIKQTEPVEPEKKYYMGFEVRSYEGENIIVSVDDYSIEGCTENLHPKIIKEVTEKRIIDTDGNDWIYAVLLTCNNHLISLKDDK